MFESELLLLGSFISSSKQPGTIHLALESKRVVVSTLHSLFFSSLGNSNQFVSLCCLAPSNWIVPHLQWPAASRVTFRTHLSDQGRLNPLEILLPKTVPPSPDTPVCPPRVMSLFATTTDQILQLVVLNDSASEVVVFLGYVENWDNLQVNLLGCVCVCLHMYTHMWAHAYTSMIVMNQIQFIYSLGKGKPILGNPACVLYLLCDFFYCGEGRKPLCFVSFFLPLVT